jgi:hypothetical protein
LLAAINTITGRDDERWPDRERGRDPRDIFTPRRYLSHTAGSCGAVDRRRPEPLLPTASPKSCQAHNDGNDGPDGFTAGFSSRRQRGRDCRRENSRMWRSASDSDRPCFTRIRTTEIRRTLLAAMAFPVLVTALVESSQGTSTALPSRLESYLSTAVRPTAAERRLLVNGDRITKLLDADASKEVAVFGAVWINAPIRRYVEAVKDIENFERGGGLRVTKRVSTPPGLEDFLQLHLPEEDVADLRSCRIEDCELKLGQQTLQAFQAEVDWKVPATQAAAAAVMRRLAYQCVTGYLAGGNGRLAVYRDNSRPTFVAEEFRSMVDQMPSLTTYMPDLRRYLLDYPNAPLPDSTSFLYWQETEFTINRSRSDGLSGFTGFIVRRRVRSEVQNGTLTALNMTKHMLEQAR